MSALKDPRQHDDLLNFQLKQLLSLGGAPAIRLCEGRFGISRLQWRLTAALVEHGPLSPTELAQRSQVEAARVSRNLPALVAKRFVERTTAPGDRRRVQLRATPEGHALYRDLFPRLADINRRLMDVLDEQEAQLLEAWLQRLTAHARTVLAQGAGVPERTGRYLGTGRRRAGAA